MRIANLGSVVGLCLVVLGCTPAGPRESVFEAQWLPHSPEARTETLARHLRGLDVAMLEIGHRYSELYWAGRDGNWRYADYQAGKIERNRPSCCIRPSRNSGNTSRLRIRRASVPPSSI